MADAKNEEREIVWRGRLIGAQLNPDQTMTMHIDGYLPLVINGQYELVRIREPRR